MADDAFVRIDGIEAESTDARHPGWMEIFDFRLGIKQHVTTAPSSGGGPCGQVVAGWNREKNCRM